MRWIVLSFVLVAACQGSTTTAPEPPGTSPVSATPDSTTAAAPSPAPAPVPDPASVRAPVAASVAASASPSAGASDAGGADGGRKLVDGPCECSRVCVCQGIPWTKEQEAERSRCLSQCKCKQCPRDIAKPPPASGP